MGQWVASYSLRKGGASWFKFHTRLSDDIVQAQGGWATPDVMHRFHASYSDDELRTSVMSTMGSANVSIASAVEFKLHVPLFKRALQNMPLSWSWHAVAVCASKGLRFGGLTARCVCVGWRWPVTLW